MCETDSHAPGINQLSVASSVTAGSGSGVLDFADITLYHNQFDVVWFGLGFFLNEFLCLVIVFTSFSFYSRLLYSIFIILIGSIDCIIWFKRNNKHGVHD